MHNRKFSDLAFEIIIPCAAAAKNTEAIIDPGFSAGEFAGDSAVDLNNDIFKITGYFQIAPASIRHSDTGFPPGAFEIFVHKFKTDPAFAQKYSQSGMSAAAGR